MNDYNITINIYIMTIDIKRKYVTREVTEGSLIIDGVTVCDTLENSYARLPEGTYDVHIHKCHQYKRKMLLLTCPERKDKEKTDNGSPSEAIQKTTLRCRQCKQIEEVNNNTSIPVFCPMIKPGNGIYKRSDGSIRVGQRACFGCLIKTRDVCDALYDRIRMNFLRGHSVKVVIEE